jgi:hypothetical protein
VCTHSRTITGGRSPSRSDGVVMRRRRCHECNENPRDHSLGLFIVDQGQRRSIPDTVRNSMKCSTARCWIIPPSRYSVQAHERYRYVLVQYCPVRHCAPSTYRVTTLVRTLGCQASPQRDWRSQRQGAWRRSARLSVCPEEVLGAERPKLKNG